MLYPNGVYGTVDDVRMMVDESDGDESVAAEQPRWNIGISTGKHLFGLCGNQCELIGRYFIA